MKKIQWLLFTCIIFLFLLSCQEKVQKYADEKILLSNLIKETDSFTHEMDRTNNRIAMGRTIITYIAEIRRLKPRLWKLEKICPNFNKTFGYKNAPKELKELVKEFGQSMSQMKLVMEGKMAKFSTDKDLIKIFEELNEILYYY